MAMLEGHIERVWSLAWNPLSGHLLKLVSCSGDKTVRIWERSPFNSWECQAVLDDPHTRTVRSCCWSPSGKFLATTAIFQEVGDDYECVSTLENEVRSVSWNASGSLLVTCGRDKTVWIWSMLDNIIASGAAEDAIRFFVENNESDSLADGPSYNMLLKKEKAHDMDINSVQWCSGENRLLASAADDGTIKIWELTSVSC